MSCHGNEKEKNNSHKHSPIKHMLHMILCCGLPIVVVGFLPLITKFSPSLGSAIGRIVPFLCPLMMGLMMFSMMGGKKEKSCCHSASQEGNAKEII